jgi:hypothetical protein
LSKPLGLEKAAPVTGLRAGLELWHGKMTWEILLALLDVRHPINFRELGAIAMNFTQLDAMRCASND